MNNQVQEELKKIFNVRFSTSESTRANYARGEDTYDPVLSKAVVFPETNEEVSKVLKLCNEHKIPVVPFGTGTSLEGNVLGNENGITISLEKMNKVLSVNASDFDCRVQANVTRKQLNEYLREDGVFFPIDPGADAALGGMAATSASGTMAVKYGTMRTVISGLTVVLANGDIIKTGSRTKKTSAGYNLTNLFIGSTAVLVGIGLGLQDAFRDLIAGFILLLEGNIRVGDVIKISPTSQEEPLVVRIKKINIRTTQIQTWEGNVLVIPNTILTRDKVENWSHGSKLTRFIINVTVAYGSNTELVKDLLKEAANGHPKVKKTHQIIVRLSDFGDNGLQLELIFWADQHWDVQTYKSEIRFEIDRLFRKHNIRIPYPQRTLHMPSQD